MLDFNFFKAAAVAAVATLDRFIISASLLVRFRGIAGLVLMMIAPNTIILVVMSKFQNTVLGSLLILA